MVDKQRKTGKEEDSLNVGRQTEQRKTERTEQDRPKTKPRWTDQTEEDGQNRARQMDERKTDQKEQDRQNRGRQSKTDRTEQDRWMRERQTKQEFTTDITEQD